MMKIEVSQRLQSPNQIDEWASNQVERFRNKFNHADWTTGSGWVFRKISLLTIQFSKVKQTRAGSYIATPEVLALKRAVDNIKNTDEKCLVWSLLAFLHYDN